MARRPRSKPTEASNSKLLEAARFVSMACADKGPINETHMYLGAHWAVASNGVITIATKIDEDVYACPQSKFLVEALSKCGDTFAITQLENSLSIKATKFKAVIPCIDPTLLTIPSPDEPVAEINDNFRLGLEKVGVLVNENAQTIVPASILLNGRSLISSDRTVLFQFWHGIDLPSGLSLPKAIIGPLVKAGKKLSKLGFSHSSLTFYYEDDSWIKTQLFVEKWPEIELIFDTPSNQMPFPKDFWEGFAAVSPFSGDGAVYFDAGIMRSHAQEGVGAAFDVPGLPKGPIFSTRALGLLKGLADTVDFFTPGKFKGSTMLTFQGANIRGAIAGRSQ
jgi:hypothetical protein